MNKLEILYKVAENLSLQVSDLNKKFESLNSQLKRTLDDIKEEEKSTIPYQVGRLYGRKAANGHQYNQVYSFLKVQGLIYFVTISENHFWQNSLADKLNLKTPCITKKEFELLLNNKARVEEFFLLETYNPETHILNSKPKLDKSWE